MTPSTATSPSLIAECAIAITQGFTWGSSPTDLLSFLSPTHSKFDLILLSDLVFNHTQHPALLDSCLSCLAPASPASPPPTTTPSPSSSPPLPDVDLSSARGRQGPVALCFFSHHRPWLVEADLGILTVAEEMGWKVEKVWEDKEAGVSSLSLAMRGVRACGGVLIAGGWIPLRSLHSRRTAETWQSAVRCTDTRSGASRCSQSN